MAGQKGDGVQESPKNNQPDLLQQEIHQNLIKGLYTSGGEAERMAPSSDLTKFGIVTIEGAKNLLPGMANKIHHDVTHPWETAKMLGTSAAIGAGMRLVLPESAAGKAIAGTVGAIMIVKSAAPVYNAYSKGFQARTYGDLQLAGKDLGYASGAFVVDTTTNGIVAGLASKYTGRALLSERMDGFAEAKYKFWNKAENQFNFVFGGPQSEGITAGSVSMQPMRYRIEGNKARLLDTSRPAPEGAFKGHLEVDAQMEVSVYLKSKASDFKIARTIQRQQAGISDFVVDDAKFQDKFGASPKAVAEINKFAADNGLKIAEMDSRSGQVVLSGTAGKFSEAFSTKLSKYESSSGFQFRGREGALSVPTQLAPHIEGVFGLDNRPQAHTHYVRGAQYQISTEAMRAHAASAEPAPKPLMPNEVADLYNFPKGTTGKGQGVAIIELGGGIDMANERAYYKAHGLPMPRINVIEIGGAKNAPGDPHGADGEVALDSQVVGTVAPKAVQNLIFAPNSDRGFIDAVTRSTFPKAGEVPNQAISISWGAPEEGWTSQGTRGMNLAFQKARIKGIGTYAAAGDDGAIDAASSGKMNADYPSSDPNVTGTGGTRLVGRNGKIVLERAWNNGPDNGAGGGGISEIWDVPDYQKGLQMPPNGNKTGKSGRGVPDVAGNADPRSGYIIRVGGEESAIGGTSAVSPLYSALHVRITESLGRPIGNLNPFLYKAGANSGIFNDIIIGNNNGYETKPGWDAVTGWGSLNGTNLLNALKADAAVKAKVTSSMWATPLVVNPLKIAN